MKKEIVVKIFGRDTTIDWDYAAKKVIAHLTALKDLIKQPVVYDKCSCFPITFFGYDCEDPYLFSSNVIDWLNEKFEGKYTVGGFPEDALFKHAVVDDEWTKWRNRDLTAEFYKKLTFDQEVQDLVNQHIDSKILEINTKWDEVKTAIEKEKKEKEEERDRLLNGVEWNYTEKEIHDEGGKTKEYLHTLKVAGKIYKFIERNVFDFGRVVILYPHTVIGHKGNEYYTEKWVDKSGWCRDRDLTPDEIRAYTIVRKYGPFANSYIRM